MVHSAEAVAVSRELLVVLPRRLSSAARERVTGTAAGVIGSILGLAIQDGHEELDEGHPRGAHTSFTFARLLAETVHLARLEIIVVRRGQHVRNHRLGTVRESRVLMRAFIQLFNDWTSVILRPPTSMR